MPLCKYEGETTINVYLFGIGIARTPSRPLGPYSTYSTYSTTLVFSTNTSKYEGETTMTVHLFEIGMARTQSHRCQVSQCRPLILRVYSLYSLESLRRLDYSYLHTLKDGANFFPFAWRAVRKIKSLPDRETVRLWFRGRVWLCDSEQGGGR